MARADLAGEAGNVFVRPDGDRIWPSLGDAASVRSAGPLPRLLQYQVVQHAVDVVEMRLVAERPLTADEEARLHAHLQRTLGATFALTVTYFDEIRRHAGKFEDSRRRSQRERGHWRWWRWVRMTSKASWSSRQSPSMSASKPAAARSCTGSPSATGWWEPRTRPAASSGPSGSRP